MVNSDEPPIELTQGARDALDLVVEKVRLDVLRRAAAIATDPSEGRIEITGRDIRTAADEVLGAPRSKPVRRLALQRVLLVYVGIGLAVVVAAGFGLAVQTFQKNLDPLTGFAATAAVGGALLAGISAFLAYYMGRTATRRLDAARSETGLGAADDFITTWALVEEKVRKLAASALGETAQDAPFSSLVPALAGAGVSAAELKDLDDLRQLRNRVVHGRLERPEPALASARARARALLQSLTRLSEAS